MNYVFESGETCIFPLVQEVYGREYIPDEASYTIKDRTGTEILSGVIENSQPFFEIIAPIVTERTPYWMSVRFSSGSYVGKSKVQFEVTPFRGIAATPNQARSLLGVDELTLPDSQFDFDAQFERLTQQYPALVLIPNLDKLLLYAEVTRLALMVAVWLPRTQSQDDVSIQRYSMDLKAYAREYEQLFYAELFRLVPDLSSDYEIPTLFQFATLTDAFTGED